MPEMIKIAARDGGSFNAYIARPKTLPAPAIIVIQEIFGINQEMREKCDELARQGYIAVCPDLFWRLEPGIELTDKTDAEWQKAFDLFNRFNVDQGVKDLQDTEEALRRLAGGNGRVGCVGYCLGGKLAYLMACRTKIDCAVGYYGVNIENLLEESVNISAPLMLHIAEEDKFVSKDAQKRIKDALDKNRQIAIHSYPGVDHAFARGNGQHYNADAASLANKRTASFFSSNLAVAKAA